MKLIIPNRPAGLRPQETLALEWRHVRERTLLVERALSDGQLKPRLPASSGRRPTVRSVRKSYWVSNRYHYFMAMTLRLTDAQTEALRARANKEGRSMQQVALSAIDEYVLRTQDDELTDRLTEQGAQRFTELLRRLGE